MFGRRISVISLSMDSARTEWKFMQKQSLLYATNMWCRTIVHWFQWQTSSYQRCSNVLLFWLFGQEKKSYKEREEKWKDRPGVHLKFSFMFIVKHQINKTFPFSFHHIWKNPSSCLFGDVFWPLYTRSLCSSCMLQYSDYVVKRTRCWFEMVWAFFL